MVSYRKTCAVYMDYEIFKVFTLYASKQKPLTACEVWERVLVQYMANNPIDYTTINIQQQIASEIPSKQEELKMRLISDNILFIFERFEAVGKDRVPLLLIDLAKLVKKGVEIKKPTEEFLQLLERAMNEL